MKHISIPPPEAIQHCPRCVHEQHQSPEYESPPCIYSEKNDKPIGYCETHGPFELDIYPAFQTEEQFQMTNYHLFMNGVLTGGSLMIGRTEADGVYRRYLAIRNEDDSISIIAKMFCKAEGELLT